MNRELRVLKAERRIELWEEGACVSVWPCHLGRVPQGDKTCEGDGRTPEGAFYICTRHEGSRFHRFLGLSYPRPSDLSKAALTPEQAESIRDAHRRGVRPPWETPLGGQIGIHGAPNGCPMPEGDWTEGCIAIAHEALMHLWDRCPLGTSVVIQ